MGLLDAYEWLARQRGVGAPLANRVNRAAGNIMGPHLRQGAKPLADAYGLLSMGADIKDMGEFSNSSARNFQQGNFGGGLLDLAYAGVAPVGMLLPGSVGMYRRGAEEIADHTLGLLDDVDPSMPRRLMHPEIFAGQNASGADLNKLARAQEMEAAGEGAEAAWRETGWFKGQDGKWRFEIDDSVANYAKEGTARATVAEMGDIINHPALYDAYPDTQGILTKVNDSAPPGGSYTYPESREHMGLFDLDEEITVMGPNRRSIALHELQHAIQAREGFASGSSQGTAGSKSTARMARELRDAMTWRKELARKRASMPQADSIAVENAVVTEYLQAGLELPSRTAREYAANQHIDSADAEKMIRRYGFDRKIEGDTPFEMYRRSAGETEARNVEARRNMTPSERAESFPRSTEDIPADRQIVEFGAPVSDAALPMDEASRMARAEEGYPVESYHGTRSEFDEFEGRGFGDHFGTSEQAEQRLRNTRRERGHEGTERVLPVRLNIRNPLQMEDVGEWNNPANVAEGLMKTQVGTKNARTLDEIIEEAEELRPQFDDADAWLASPEAEGMLDEMRRMVEADGYDGVKYANKVENAYGESAGLTTDAAKRRDDIWKRIRELQHAAAERKPAPSLDEVGADPDALQRWLDGPKSAPTKTEADELARLHKELSSLPTNDPNSYITLDPSQVRSRFAKFDPAKKDSANILAGIGGLGLLGVAASKDDKKKKRGLLNDPL